MVGPVVVVGGGIIGTAVARQLVVRGVEVTLVSDPASPGASYASFASLTALDEPLTEVYALKCLGMSYWRRWQSDLGAALVRWEGELRWAENQRAAEELRVTVKRATKRGYPVEPATRSDIVSRLPHARPAEEVLEASWAPGDGQADPPAAISRLLEAFRQEGGRVLAGRAALSFVDDGVRVRAGDQEVAAEKVVIAGGAQAKLLMDGLGWELPMDPSPGLLAVTQPLDPLIAGTVYVAAREGPSIHLRQRPDARVLIGEKSQAYVATRPTREHAEELLAQAGRVFPALAGAEVDHFTVEWRPMPRDGMPVIGPLPGLDSVYLAAAHAGVTLAPAVGFLVAQELVEGTGPPQLSAFSLERFVRREAALAEQVEAAFRS